MLSRTAGNLFWMARYVERAECLARILDATSRLAALPQAYGTATNEWESALITSAALDAFESQGRPADERSVFQFLALSDENPSSIYNCFKLARANARSVRPALTVEMWDAINGAWHELRKFNFDNLEGEAITRFLDFVKAASIRIDGSGYRTMLRNDAYWFSRLGVLIERAEATARILDVKYHVLLPRAERVGGPLDYFQWNSILRSVSAATSYHWVYRDRVKPWLVADLLILNEQMPRSLACCYRNMSEYLDELAQFYGRQGPAQREARGIRSRLLNRNIDQIFQSGLHEFIQESLDENAGLANTIANQYLL